MNDNAISVILPVYNGEAYIEEAIDSILNQTFTNFELIIIDDSSTDRTSEKILGYNDCRIVYKHNRSNLGNYYARNIGIQLAKGKYVAVMDADDVANPERLQKEYYYLEEHLDTLAVGSAVIINNGYRTIKLLNKFEEILVALLENNCFVHSSLLIRIDVIRELKGYNTQYEYAADYDLICRMALLGKIENLPDILMMYRVHEKQISQQFVEKQQGYANEIRREYQLSFIRKYVISETQNADHYTVSMTKMGMVICLHIYSVYTGCSTYKKRADSILEEIINQVETLGFYNSNNHLCSFCCGILYLLRNNLVEGCEEEVLEDIEKQLNVFYTNQNSIQIDNQNIAGWIHYLRIRVKYDKSSESVWITNVYLLNYLIDIIEKTRPDANQEEKVVVQKEILNIERTVYEKQKEIIRLSAENKEMIGIITQFKLLESNCNKYKLEKDDYRFIEAYHLFSSLANYPHKSICHTSTEWELLFTWTNLTNREFHTRLSQEYPTLKKCDLQICCLLKLGFSNEEIRSIFDIQQGTLYTDKTHAKHRLGINEDVKIETWLSKY